MPITNLVANVFDQTFKRHPYLFVFVVCCCVLVFVASWRVFAQQADVTRTNRSLDDRMTARASVVDQQYQVLEARVSGLESSLKEGFLVQRLHSLESEIYEYERLVASGSAAARDHRWLVNLRNSLGDVEREMERLNSP